MGRQDLCARMELNRPTTYAEFIPPFTDSLPAPGGAFGYNVCECRVRCPKRRAALLEDSC